MSRGKSHNISSGEGRRQPLIVLSSPGGGVKKNTSRCSGSEHAGLGSWRGGGAN